MAGEGESISLTTADAKAWPRRFAPGPGHPGMTHGELPSDRHWWAARAHEDGVLQIVLMAVTSLALPTWPVRPRPSSIVRSRL